MDPQIVLTNCLYRFYGLIIRGEEVGDGREVEGVQCYTVEESELKNLGLRTSKGKVSMHVSRLGRPRCIGWAVGRSDRMTLS